MFLNIEVERIKNNLSKERIAEKLNITPKTYTRWVNEITPIPSNALIKMSVYFAVSIDYLLDNNTQNTA